MNESNRRKAEEGKRAEGVLRVESHRARRDDRGERPAGRAELLAKKVASGRMQRPPELVPIPGCCVK